MLTFSGKYLYKVDAKGRVNIPSYFRNQLVETSHPTFHIMMGPNECLFVYPQEIFIRIASSLEIQYGSLSTPDEERRYFLETMSAAQPARCDQQGRLILTSGQLDYSKISDEVLIIGAVNKIELWNPAGFQRFIRESPNSSMERVQRYGRADRFPLPG